MKRKFNPVIFVLIIPLAAVLFAAASFYFKRAAVSEAAEFPYDAYIADAGSLAGNVYKLNAQIDSQLAYGESAGKVVCVNLSGGEPLALFVPKSLSQNLYPGQKYTFEVGVLSSGAIKVLNSEKF
ncbi:MAG: hypothetical protein J6P03_03585 [Opitutales bacterium]|nr:hypothetical protein [Opitutales bacterium]